MGVWVGFGRAGVGDGREREGGGRRIAVGVAALVGRRYGLPAHRYPHAHHISHTCLHLFCCLQTINTVRVTAGERRYAWKETKGRAGESEREREHNNRG